MDLNFLKHLERFAQLLISPGEIVIELPGLLPNSKSSISISVRPIRPGFLALNYILFLTHNWVFRGVFYGRDSRDYFADSNHADLATCLHQNFWIPPAFGGQSNQSWRYAYLLVNIYCGGYLSGSYMTQFFD